MAILYVNSGDAYLDTRRLVVTVKDSAGATVDISATDLRFMVKDGEALDVDALIDKMTPTDIEVATPQTGATKGVAYIALDSEDTEDLRGRYLWELQGIDSVGVVTLASGAIYIKSDLVLAAS